LRAAVAGLQHGAAAAAAAAEVAAAADGDAEEGVRLQLDLLWAEHGRLRDRIVAAGATLARARRRMQLPAPTPGATPMHTPRVPRGEAAASAGRQGSRDWVRDAGGGGGDSGEDEAGGAGASMPRRPGSIGRAVSGPLPAGPAGLARSAAQDGVHPVSGQVRL
jgi:hypothetical protein